MKILVLNAGSSSLKVQLLNVQEEGSDLLLKGIVESIGSNSVITLEPVGRDKLKHVEHLRDHKAAIEWVLTWLTSPEASLPGVESLSDIRAVGHRVVHGGERFVQSVVIDDDVISDLQDCIDLAPLHNPANLRGIYAVREILGSHIPQVAVFDTAFHASMEPTEYLYALPYEFYTRYRVRRYGFHGTSHRYVVGKYGELAGHDASAANIITLHLGNGCSACGVRRGKSFVTSMGLTPVEGLVMGTRSGDVDAGVVDYVASKEGSGAHELLTVLNRRSGLLGISGITNDMRDLLARIGTEPRALLAVEMFCRRVVHYVGGYYAQMGGAEAIVFTGGIGENSLHVRERICKGLACFGMEFDAAANERTRRGAMGLISTPDSRLKAWVIPTNEELLIARDTLSCVQNWEVRQQLKRADEEKKKRNTR